MSLKKTAVYLLCFLFLLGFYYQYELREQREQIERKASLEEAKRLFPFPATEIQSVRILSREEGVVSLIHLTKEGEVWRLTEPIEAEGNQEEIANILEALGEVKIQRIIEEHPSHLEAFGLDKPILQVEVLLRDGQKVGLLFGHHNPAQTAFYAKKTTDPMVFLVALGFKYRLGKKVEVLQAKEKKLDNQQKQQDT